jgi:hypothetical protein
MLAKYSELNTNHNLQVFIMAGTAEFMALCRKIVMSYYENAKVKITKTQMTNNDWADVEAEIDTPKWSDTVMFRFIRSTGNVGEYVLRDFHARIKEIKAGKGICMSVGNFSDEAKRFTQARLIDLVEKGHLESILASLDSKIPEAAIK